MQSAPSSSPIECLNVRPFGHVASCRSMARGTGTFPRTWGRASKQSAPPGHLTLNMSAQGTGNPAQTEKWLVRRKYRATGASLALRTGIRRRATFISCHRENFLGFFAGIERHRHRRCIAAEISDAFVPDAAQTKCPCIPWKLLSHRLARRRDCK